MLLYAPLTWRQQCYALFVTSLKDCAAEIPKVFFFPHCDNRKTGFPTSNYAVTDGKIFSGIASRSTTCWLESVDCWQLTAVSQVNSFQLQEKISPNWISLCLSRQPIVAKWVDVPLTVGRWLPRKHCQSQVNASLATLVPKSCQGNTLAHQCLSPERAKWARQPKAPCW